MDHCQEHSAAGHLMPVAGGQDCGGSELRNPGSEGDRAPAQPGANTWITRFAIISRVLAA